MLKKFILLLLIVVSVNAQNSKYLNEKDYTNYDFRIFAGLGTSISYISSSEPLDYYMYSYNAYVGLPVFFGNELIFKKEKQITDNFDLIEQSFSLNLPLDSRGTRQEYIGLVAGIAKMTWNDYDVNNLNLSKKVVEDNFYGLHIGKRYKFTRNYYVRIELEGIKYNNSVKSGNGDLDTNYSVSFNYGFEYRF